MMLKRQDAFTLVELLAVIIILGIILVLAIPRVSDMINKYRDKAYERQLDLILKAAEQYSVLYEDEIEWDVNQAFIYLEDLQNKDLIANPLKNPKGGEFEPDRVVVTLTSFNGVIDYAIAYLGPPPPPPPTLASIIKVDEDVEHKYEGTLNEAHFYVGPDPDNWIEFGTINDAPVLWRIIKSNEEGIKIIYEGLRKPDNTTPDDEGKMNGTTYKWDASYNRWETSSLKTALNTWYTTTLTISNPNYIAPIKWCIGASPDPSTLDDFLDKECEDWSYMGNTRPGKTANPTGAGLIRASDYISTCGDAACTASGQTVCGKTADGVSTNFLFKSYIYWTQTARAATSDYVWNVRSTGYLLYNGVSNERGVRPVLNLKSEILHDSGEGTISSPYKVKEGP